MDERARRIALECKGFMHDEEGMRLHALAREHAPLGPIVEIGSYCGKSSVYIGTGVREVWFVLHGFGQLSPYFIRHFGVLADGTRLIVAPEALNRFYLERTSWKGAGTAPCRWRR